MMKSCPDTFGEFAIVIGVLPSRDFEIRGAIVRLAKINTILTCSVNKLFPIENTYQVKTVTKQTRQGNKSSGEKQPYW